jgi:hypothetical protein
MKTMPGSKVSPPIFIGRWTIRLRGSEPTFAGRRQRVDLALPET